MKKWLSLALILALTAISLSACRRGGEESAPEQTAAPGPGYTVTDGGVTGNVTAQQPSVPDPLATLTPQQRAAITVGGSNETADGELLPPGGDLAAMQQAQVQDDVVLGTYDEEADTGYHDAPSAINTAAFQYSAVMDENLDYTFNYPSDWENVPGIYTVCFRERVEEGDFPARVAITRKKLVHTPDETALMEQLTSYLKSVAKQYDAETFQTSEPDKDARFMGRLALSNTYLAYWGDIEVKGFVIGATIDRTLYVFHFCASYSDYVALESVMQYMMTSVQLTEAAKAALKKKK